MARHHQNGSQNPTNLENLTESSISHIPNDRSEWLMVAIMQQQQQQQHQQQQQNPSALVPFQLKNPQSSTTTAAAATPLRSPSAQSQLSSPLSVVPPLRQSPLSSHPVPVTSVEPALTAVPTCPLVRVRLSDIAPYDGAPGGPYLRAMEALCGSLLRHNAALIELGNEDTALMRCGLEGARLFFRSRAHLGSGKGSRGVYMYRAGRYKPFNLKWMSWACLG